MGESQRTCEVEGYLDSIFLLSAFAHIRPLFKEVGLEADGGLILFVQDYTKKDAIVNAFERCSCVKSQIYRNKTPSFPNYKLVMIEHQPFFDMEVIEEFLGCEDYLPVLVVSGYMPENLRGRSNIISLEEGTDCSFGSARKRGELFDQFASYSHQNADDILYTLTKFVESDEYAEVMYKPMICQALYYTAKLYCYYLVAYIKVASFETIFDLMIEHVEELYRSFDADFGDVEILPAVNKVLVAFLNKDKNILIGHVDSVEGELLIAVKQERAILYDDDFYYISDKLLREATKTLQEIMAYPSIKMSLHHENVLVSNDVKENYTIKKVIISSYGETMRLRFLKLDRTKADDEAGLSIAERRNAACT